MQSSQVTLLQGWTGVQGGLSLLSLPWLHPSNDLPLPTDSHDYRSAYGLYKGEWRIFQAFNGPDPPFVSGIVSWDSSSPWTWRPWRNPKPTFGCLWEAQFGTPGELPDKRTYALMPGSEFRWRLPAHVLVVGVGRHSDLDTMRREQVSEAPGPDISSKEGTLEGGWAGDGCLGEGTWVLEEKLIMELSVLILAGLCDIWGRGHLLLAGGAGAPWWGSETLYHKVMLENFLLTASMGKALTQGSWSLSYLLSPRGSSALSTDRPWALLTSPLSWHMCCGYQCWAVCTARPK